jgi:hypothetical protein
LVAEPELGVEPEETLAGQEPTAEEPAAVTEEALAG